MQGERKKDREEERQAKRVQSGERKKKKKNDSDEASDGLRKRKKTRGTCNEGRRYQGGGREGKARKGTFMGGMGEGETGQTQRKTNQASWAAQSACQRVSGNQPS